MAANDRLTGIYCRTVEAVASVGDSGHEDPVRCLYGLRHLQGVGRLQCTGKIAGLYVVYLYLRSSFYRVVYGKKAFPVL